jgi:putative spermidine/putrescine transport system ATP-binding protein
VSDFANQALSVSGLEVRYGQKHVVRAVSFEANAGSIFGLLGPSGAGKSSVLAALSGVVPAHGEIRVSGADLASLPARKRQFGHVYQEFRLFDWMSIRDNIAFPCDAMGWSSDDTDKAVEAILLRVGLRLPPNQPVRSLSGGERQRVAIARALVFRPRVLLLDEPFTHLDPPLRDELKRDLLMVLQDQQIPIVLVTHDHREAFELCDQIGIMIEGALVQSGAPAELISSPISYDVARVLGFSNSAYGTVLSTSNGQTEVRLTDGGSVLKSRTLYQVQCGERVQIACRPERVRVSNVPEESDVGITGRVVAIHVLMDTQIAIIQIAENRQWTAKIPLATAVLAGDTVTCSIHPDDLMVYKAETL